MRGRAVELIPGVRVEEKYRIGGIKSCQPPVSTRAFQSKTLLVKSRFEAVISVLIAQARRLVRGWGNASKD